MDIYKAYYNALGPRSDQIVVYKPVPFVMIQQRGDDRPIYLFDKKNTIAKLSGDNFIASLCGDNYADDVEYDSINNVWKCGEESDPDFLLYLLRYIKNERIDYFITNDDIPTLRNIYKKYNFPIMVELIDKLQPSWCALI